MVLDIRSGTALLINMALMSAPLVLLKPNLDEEYCHSRVVTGKGGSAHPKADDERYCRTSAAAPATAGVAIDVP